MGIYKIKVATKYGFLIQYKSEINPNMNEQKSKLFIALFTTLCVFLTSIIKPENM